MNDFVLELFQSWMKLYWSVRLLEIGTLMQYNVNNLLKIMNTLL